MLRSENKVFLKDGCCLDAVSWFVSGWVVRKRIWKMAGELKIRVGNTTVIIHSNNNNEDTGLEKFKEKLLLLLFSIKEFIEQAPRFDPKKEKNKVIRQWLNDPEGIDYEFTGSVCSIYGDRCILEISSCDRSIRFDLYPKNKNKGMKEFVESANAENRSILRRITVEIDRAIVAIEQINNSDLAKGVSVD